MRAQAFKVIDQLGGGVFLDRSEGLATLAAALIEQDDAVVRRIEEASLHGRAAAPWPAV